MDVTIRKFWQEYIELKDYFDRREKLKTLPFIKDLPKLIDSNKCKKADYITLISYLITSQFQSYADDIIENLNSAPKGAKTNKDLEVSASPTPKVCPVCKSDNLKLMLKNEFRCLDCNSQGHLGKPSLNTNIKRNNQRVDRA